MYACASITCVQLSTAAVLLLSQLFSTPNTRNLHNTRELLELQVTDFNSWWCLAVF
jgi:hypothetical protein